MFQLFLAYQSQQITKYQDPLIYALLIFIILLKSSVLICVDSNFCMYLVSWSVFSLIHCSFFPHWLFGLL